MWNKVITWVLGISGIALIFIAPISYLIWKYGGTTTTTVEVTNSSMPIIILLIISAFALVVITWLGSQILVVYWEYIKKHPFGQISTMSFGAIILVLTILGIQWINKFADLVNYNAEQFINDLDTYKGSMNVILIYVAIGLGLSLASYIWNKATA